MPALACQLAVGRLTIYQQMPNWCYNSVSIKGEPSDLKKLMERIHGEYAPISFERVVPEPPGLHERSEEGEAEPSAGDLVGLPDWYQWRCSNWGTKWDVDGEGGNDVNLHVYARNIELVFQTAWSPPLPLMDALAEQHPQLSFDHIFCDEGMSEAGRVVWINGEVKMQEAYDSSRPEYSAIAHEGCRVEESGLHTVDWNSEVPLHRGLAAVKKNGGEDEDNILMERREDPRKAISGGREDRVRKVLHTVDSADKLKEAVGAKVLEMARRAGFSFEGWAAAGIALNQRNMWEADTLARECVSAGSSSEYSVGFVRPRPHKKKEDDGTPSEGGDGAHETRSRLDSPKIVLRPNLRRGALDRRAGARFGHIRVLSHGVELHCPNGWTFAGLIKDGVRGYVLTRHQEQDQNWLGGDPACAVLQVSPDGQRVYEAARVYCSEGKIWDPDKNTPALSMRRYDGSLRREARFFAGKNTGKSGEPAFTDYHEDGKTVKSSKPAKLPRGRKTGTSKNKRSVAVDEFA